jgi:hypothetical protein
MTREDGSIERMHRKDDESGSKGDTEREEQYL